MACYCKPSLLAYTTPAQTISAGGNVAFNINKILTGKAIEYSANAITISYAGVYFVSVDLDVAPDAAGNITVQVYNNGVAVPDAVTTYAGVADTVQHIHLDTLVKVLPSCCVVSNNANLTVNISEAATVTNAKIIVF